MSNRHLYPKATEPTAPRFKVGDVVYTKAMVDMPGYVIDMDDTLTIDNLINAHGYTSDEVMVQPAVFGLVVDYQDRWVRCLVGRGTIPSHHDPIWRGVEDPYAEAELDLPGSGSIWFLPDNERRYFVKWINKETYKYNETPNEFAPMRSNAGDEVFNTSLHPEQYMWKAPDFIGKLRKKVAERHFAVESVLGDRLNIDYCSTKGIAGIVCQY
jgi:hypothetical protein